MTAKRFKRYLLDGGFSFDDEYIPPRWSILDEKNNKSLFGFLEFEDEHKELCDEIVDSLNEFADEYNHLKKENERLKKSIDYQDETIKKQCIKLDWASECGVKWDKEFKNWKGYE